MRAFILRGVPQKLKQDGWWLDPITTANAASPIDSRKSSSARFSIHAFFLTVLIVIAHTEWPVPSSVMLTSAKCKAPENSNFHGSGEKVSIWEIRRAKTEALA